MELDDLADHVSTRAAATPHPIVVGISGFCGSGKSTLARALVDAVPGSLRLRGDDFLDPVRSHGRSECWDGVERERLVVSVLAPFRAGRPSTFQRYDWSARRLGPAEALPDASVLVVDLIGLLHPEALPHLDVTVWCDVDLETAVARGRARDARLGRDHETLWRDVWVPNERAFAARFAPRDAAGIRYVAAT
jgi:uridine kinase